MRVLAALIAGSTLCLAACGSVHLPGSHQAAVIPWIDATPSLPMPVAPVIPSIPPGTQTCAAESLRATYEGDGGLGGGQLIASISFVNVSATACVLQGTLGVSLLDAEGDLLETTPSGFRVTDRMDPVLLAPEDSSAQATLQFVWPAIDVENGGIPCPAPAAATVKVELPAGGGTLTLSTASPAIGRPITIAPCYGLIAVGAFQAVEPVVQPTPTPHPFTYRVDLPISVEAGESLRYTVTFTNVTKSPVVFSDPCPAYQEDLYQGSGLTGMPFGKHFYVLNCRLVPSISPGASVTFAMVLDVPVTAPTGTYTLLWNPTEGLDTQNIQRVPITTSN